MNGLAKMHCDFRFSVVQVAFVILGACTPPPCFLPFPQRSTRFPRTLAQRLEKTLSVRLGRVTTTYIPVWESRRVGGLTESGESVLGVSIERVLATRVVCMCVERQKQRERETGKWRYVARCMPYCGVAVSCAFAAAACFPISDLKRGNFP